MISLVVTVRKTNGIAGQPQGRVIVIQFVSVEASLVRQRDPQQPDIADPARNADRGTVILQSSRPRLARSIDLRPLGAREVLLCLGPQAIGCCRGTRR